MTPIALAPRAAPSLYSGVLLALIALALALQASFLAGLVRGPGALGAPPAVSERGPTPSPAPCATL